MEVLKSVHVVSPSPNIYNIETEESLLINQFQVNTYTKIIKTKGKST